MSIEEQHMAAIVVFAGFFFFMGCFVTWNNMRRPF